MFSDFTTTELIDFRNQPIEEFPVVTDYDHRSVEIAYGVFQYIFRTHIQMVGRLIEYQEIHRFEQQTNHSQTTAFASRKHFHFLIRRFSAKHESTENIPYLQTNIPFCHPVDGIEYG